MRQTRVSVVRLPRSRITKHPINLDCQSNLPPIYLDLSLVAVDVHAVIPSTGSLVSTMLLKSLHYLFLERLEKIKAEIEAFPCIVVRIPIRPILNGLSGPYRPHLFALNAWRVRRPSIGRQSRWQGEKRLWPTRIIV